VTTNVQCFHLLSSCVFSRAYLVTTNVECFRFLPELNFYMHPPGDYECCVCLLPARVEFSHGPTW